MTDALLDQHDAVLLDLDGTVYRGGEPTPSARDVIDGARAHGVAIRYVTNNASKSPDAVADHLRALGLHAEIGDVSTSAQAAAAMVAETLPRGARVLVVGTDSFAHEIAEVGLTPVRRFEDAPAAVVQGHSPDTGWAELSEACLAVRDGAMWVASNDDRTLPTERGELPGNGAMVTALRAATGREPDVAGKPQVPLLRRAIESCGAQRPLMVGDRLDTDIAGGVALGIPSLFVLTGVGSAGDVLAAPSDRRPEYIGADLRALLAPARLARVDTSEAWTARSTDARVELSRGSADAPAEPLSALRSLCTAWWAAGSGPVDVVGGDPEAKAALDELGLS